MKACKFKPNNNATLNGSELSLSSVPILSFFTGAGLLDLGFYKSGFENIVWRNEYNPNFVRGFEYAIHAHLGVEHKISNVKSIHDISAKEILDQAFHKTGKPEMFGIIGGSPCPDFAIGGKNKGEYGQHGKLSQVYVDNIISLLPTFFILENVAGLSRTGKHKVFLDRLILQLQEYYSISHKVLNALNYGAPQFRERVFVVGFRKDWLKKQFGVELQNGEEDWFPWAKEKFPNARKTYKWSQTIPFGDTPKKPRGIPVELMSGTHICNQEELSLLPNGEDIFRPKSDKFTKIAEGRFFR